MTYSRRSIVSVSLTALLLLCLQDPACAGRRDRKRLDAIEAALRKNNAVISQRLSDQDEKIRRLELKLEERSEHTGRLERRVGALERGVEEGLRAIRDTIAKKIDGKLADLERDDLVAVKERKKLLETLSVYEKTMAEFRKSIARYAGEINGKLAAVEKKVQSLSSLHEKDKKELLARVKGLVEVMDQENGRLRKAIAGLAAARAGEGGRPAGETRVHKVRKGENLWSIARKYHLTTSALLEANKQFENEDAVIHPGDEILIPLR